MGYDDAINLASEKLAHIPPQKVCEACGARYENGEFFLRWFNIESALSSAQMTHKILWLHYLTSNGSKTMTGQLIAYREAAPALFYEPNFYKRAVHPFVKCFGKTPDRLIETGIALGGKIADLGDASVTINVLPYVPMTFILWEGSEEFPPDGNILFDKSAMSWFAAEDMAVLAGAAVSQLKQCAELNRITEGELK